MTEDRDIVTLTFTWRGIALIVEYEPNWLSMDRVPELRVAHFAIRTEEEGAKLPITQTGYRSHFEHPDRVEAAGGPEAYVLAWLDVETAAAAWQEQVAASRQLRLI